MVDRRRRLRRRRTGIPALVEMPAPVTTIAFLELDIRSAIFWRSLVQRAVTVVVGIAVVYVGRAEMATVVAM